MRAEIVVYEGVDELDAIAPFEVLSVAAGSARLSVELVCLDARQSVRTAHGIELRVPAVLGAPDLLIVPGGGWAAGVSTGVRAEIARGALPAAVRACHERGAILASVCTGAMLLAHAGLLTGRPATTHHAARDALAGYGARLIDARIVDDGDIVSAAGVTSGLDLALWLVERCFGGALAVAVERQLEYVRRGPIWQAPREQHRAAGESRGPETTKTAR